jgi:hypothetical protein
MKYLWSRPGRTPRLALLITVALVAVGLALTLPALALPTMFGAQFYYAGGDVTVDLLHRDTVYDEVLQLRSGTTLLDLVHSSQVGSKVTLTQQQLAAMGIAVGDELQFGIHVLNTKQDFALGPGSRNVDGLDHAYVRTGRGGFYVGFEDLLGGGDRDYNDTIFRFTGVSTTRPQFATTTEPDHERTLPEPASLVLVLSGIAVLGFAYRRR